MASSKDQPHLQQIETGNDEIELFAGLSAESIHWANKEQNRPLFPGSIIMVKNDPPTATKAEMDFFLDRLTYAFLESAYLACN